MPEYLFNKVAGLRPATLLKETLITGVSSEFCEISKNTFSDIIPLVAALHHLFTLFALSETFESNAEMSM